MTTTATAAPAAPTAWAEWVPTWTVAAWTEKVAKANRKAARNGLGEPFAITVLGTRETFQRIGTLRVPAHESQITITGDSPALPGWSYAAAVDWSLSEPVVNVSPFFTGAGPLPRPATKHCDHCGTIRSRTATHLVVGPEGQVQQVGSSCLTAYTGITVGWVAILGTLTENDDPIFSRFDPFYSPKEVLTLGIAIVDALGYWSQAKAADNGQVTTRDRFTIAFNGPRDSRDRTINEATIAAINTRSRADSDVEAEAAAIIAWAATLSSASSDYLQNVGAILSDPTQWIGNRHLGYALSAIPAYRRETARNAERAAQVATRTPVVEGRQVIVGKIESVRSEQTQFGWQTKARITTDAGFVVWGTLPAAIIDATPGTRVELTATVTASSSDPTFGFYSRPSKAKVLA